MLSSGTESATAQHDKAFVVPVRDVGPPVNPLAEFFYRIFEMLFAAIVLILGLPFMMVAAILISVDSPGPVFFRHRRPARSVKKRGREIGSHDGLCLPPGGLNAEDWYYVPTYFRLWKFRTMYCDAQLRFPELYAYDNLSSEQFRAQYSHIPNDPRITRVGQILRKLSVDELPNLWSILTGDLRLVGPRPENPRVLRHYRPEEMYKFVCKPGVTGLAQVSGRGLLNWGETLALDLEYLRKRTIALDLRILLLTITQVLMRRGAS